MPLLPKNNFNYLNICIFIVLLLYGFALYFYPLQSKTFYFDDRFSIENNEAVKTIDIPRIFNAFNTRFLVGLSFALNYQWCGVHPAGYRLINVLIHCLNAFLVYLLAKSILNWPVVRTHAVTRHPERSEGSKGALRFFASLRMTNNLEWPAFFASMLFLCHPIQTEPVNYITQRFVLMGTFFYLLTLILSIQYRCRSQKRFIFASMGAAIAAMLCKEFVVTLPLMLAVYEFYFPDPLVKTWGQRCRRLLPFFVITLIVPVLLLRTPKGVTGVAHIAYADSVGHIDITKARFSISRQPYFLTEINVVCTYVRLLFLPIDQNVVYDYPLAHTMDKKTALCGAFLLCLLAMAAITYTSYRVVSFGILWFFIALSVESSFIPIGNVITEYRLYLASVGFVFLVMVLIYTRPTDVKRLHMMAAVIIMGFSMVTYQRNKIWGNEIILLDDAIRKSPHKAMLYNTRGWAYYTQGRMSQAFFDYNKAIEEDTDLSQAYFNRAVVYYTQGQMSQAISDFNRAVALDPDHADTYYNRGLAYNTQGQTSQAISDYNKAIELNPDFAKAYNNLGLAYDNQGQLSKAFYDYNKAIELNPEDAQAYNNRGNIYNHQGHFTQALLDCNKAIEIKPDFAEAHYNRGNVYREQNNLIQALSDYNKALEINPHYTGAYNNRGLVRDKQGKLTQAIADYNKAIEMDPRYTAAYINRAVVYYELKKYDKAWGDVHKAEGLGAIVNPGFVSALKKASGHNAIH